MTPKKSTRSMMTYTMFARTIIDPKLHTVLRCKIFLTFLDSFYSKTNQMHQCIKLILFGTDTLHVLDGLSVHHQEFKTVHTATGICRTDTGYPLASRQQYLFDKCLLLYVQS